MAPDGLAGYSKVSSFHRWNSEERNLPSGVEKMYLVPVTVNFESCSPLVGTQVGGHTAVVIVAMTLVVVVPVEQHFVGLPLVLLFADKSRPCLGTIYACGHIRGI